MFVDPVLCQLPLMLGGREIDAPPHVPGCKVQNDVVEVSEDAAAIRHLMASISASG
jgi:hypothetical protein